MAKRVGPIDPQPLTKTVLNVQAFLLIGEVAMAALSMVEINRLSSGQASIYDTMPAVSFVALYYLGVYVVAAFLTLKWIYRVNLNASTLTRGKTISPGWSVGWFFVPFANLVMPFRAMRETWRISHAPGDWRQAAAPDLLNWWWGLFLLTSILGNASGRISVGTQTQSTLVLSEQLSLASSCLAIPLILLLRTIVRQLTDAQTHALRVQTFDEPGAAATVSG